MTHAINTRERSDAEYRDVGIGHPLLVAPAGWYVDCACEWGGNGPYPSEECATEAGEQHQLAATIDDERAKAVARIVQIDPKDAEALRVAVDDYNRIGRVTA